MSERIAGLDLGAETIKVAESHLLRAESDFGLPSVTLALNGDPLDGRALEAFAYAV